MNESIYCAVCHEELSDEEAEIDGEMRRVVYPCPCHGETKE